MASAFTHIATQTNLGRVGSGTPRGTFVIPGLLSCLVLSWSKQRAQLLQAAARDETWQAEVCGDVQEFLRSVFQLEVPLTIVDLPPKESDFYLDLVEVTAQTSGINKALLVVCGAENDQVEEQWARQIGVWAYLPGVTNPSDLRVVFAEARKALAKQSTAYVESSSYR